MVQNNAKGQFYRDSLFCSNQITKFGQFSLTSLNTQSTQLKLLSGSEERYWWLSPLLLFSMTHAKTVSKFHLHFNESGKHIKNNQLLIGYAVLKNQKQIVVWNDVKTYTITSIMMSQLFSDSLGRLISNSYGRWPLIPDWCIWPDFWWP